MGIRENFASNACHLHNIDLTGPKFCHFSHSQMVREQKCCWEPQRWDNGNFKQCQCLRSRPWKALQNATMDLPKSRVCPPTAVCCKLQRRPQFRLGSLESWLLFVLYLNQAGILLPPLSVPSISEAPPLCLVPYFQKIHDSLKNRSIKSVQTTAACSAKAPCHGLQDRHISSLNLWKSTFNCTAIRNQSLFLILFPLQNGLSLKTAHKNPFLKYFRQFSSYQDYFLLFPAIKVSVSIHSYL